ncbi:MAG: type II/IV secretion system protein, partial [Prochlorothrix sp.]
MPCRPLPPISPSRPAPGPSLVEDLQLEGAFEEANEDPFDALDVEASLSASNASPVVSLVDRILVQALQRSASDIHLEPQDD